MRMLSFITKSLLRIEPRWAAAFSFAVSQLAVYSIFLFFQSFRAISGDSGISTANPFLFQVCLFILLLALLPYAFAFSTRWISAVPIRALAAVWITISFLLFLAWPITSSDIFSYVYQGRVASTHGANPYIDSYSQFPQDKLFPIISNKWSNRTTPYNPLFSLVSISITAVAKDNLLLAVGLFKLMMVIANLACGWLIYKITRSRQAFLLYAFNPLILFEFCINGHNDVLIALSILLGSFLWKNGNKNAAWAAWLAGGLIKATAWIWLPLIFIFDLAQIPKGWPRLKRGLAIASISLISYVVSYRLFFSDIGTFFSSLSSVFDVIGSYSVGVMAFYGISGFFTENPVSYAIILGKLSFMLAYISVLIVAMKEKKLKQEQIWHYAAISYSAFFIFFFSWFMPWYLTSIIPILAIAWHYSKDKAYLWSLFFFTFYGIIYYIVLR